MAQFGPESSAATALGVGGILFAFVVIGEGLRRARQPNWTINRTYTDLAIHDHDGSDATLTKSLRITPNRGGLKHVEFRDLSVDGEIASVEVEPGRLANLANEAGDSTILVELPRHLKRGETLDLRITARLVGSFPHRPQETVAIVVDRDIRDAGIRVSLPSRCRPGTATFVYRREHDDLPAPEPIITSNVITCTFPPRRWRRSFPRGQYELKWSWCSGVCDVADPRT